MANRIWHYHFGRGIVSTPGDFGRMGQKPTHPELLDYLASAFVEGRLEDEGDAPDDPAVEHVSAVIRDSGSRGQGRSGQQAALAL
jgi:hypothetical protein